MIWFSIVGTDMPGFLGILPLRVPRGERPPEETAVPIRFLGEAERELLVSPPRSAPAVSRPTSLCPTGSAPMSLARPWQPIGWGLPGTSACTASWASARTT
jgi:hypothetical protein